MDNAIYMHADTLCAPEIMDRMIASKGDIVLPVEFKKCDEEAMKVRTRNGKVVEITKAIPCESAEGEFIGIAKLDKKIIADIKAATKKVLKEGHFNYYFEGAVQDMIDRQKYDIVSVPTDQYFWGEVDFLEDYDRVTENVPENLYEIAKKYK